MLQNELPLPTKHDNSAKPPEKMERELAAPGKQDTSPSSAAAFRRSEQQSLFRPKRRRLSRPKGREIKSNPFFLPALPGKKFLSARECLALPGAVRAASSIFEAQRSGFKNPCF